MCHLTNSFFLLNASGQNKLVFMQVYNATQQFEGLIGKEM